MKKILVFIFTLLLFIPITVKAATDPVVLTVVTSSSGSTVNYSGTTENGITAVKCKLFTLSGDEVKDLSLPVDNNEFSGVFTNVADGTYNVMCARYEGGTIKSAEVVVDSTSINNQTVAPTDTNTSNATSVDNTKTNPQTYDAGINDSIILLIISTIGIIGSIIYLKSKKTSK